MHYEDDKLLYSYVEKWKFFSEMVLVLLSRRFEATYDGDEYDYSDMEDFNLY